MGPLKRRSGCVSRSGGVAGVHVRARYLEMLLSMGYGGGGVQCEEGTKGSCGCRACVGLSELMSALMGR